jgi:hypothetical protein
MTLYFSLQPVQRSHKIEPLLGAHGVPKDSAAGRREFEMRMEARRAEGSDAEWKKVRRGWMMGSEDFRKELLERMHERIGLSHYGRNCVRVMSKRRAG